MAAILPKTYITVEEYLAAEETSEIRHEYYDGERIPRVNISQPHCLICGNLIGQLHPQVREQQCRIYINGMVVKGSSEKQHYAYPDLSAVCGPSHFERDDQKILLNPNLIVEVFSPSTEKFDRGAKFESYRALPSFEEYILIAQERVYLAHHVRQSDGSWLLTEYTNLSDELRLSSIGCTLLVGELYEKVEFP